MKMVLDDCISPAPLVKRNSSLVLEPLCTACQYTAPGVRSWTNIHDESIPWYEWILDCHELTLGTSLEPGTPMHLVSSHEPNLVQTFFPPIFSMVDQI